MPSNMFSTGRDLTVNVITPQGPLNLNLVTSFTAKPGVNEKKIPAMDGIIRYARFLEGWSGSIKMERQDAALDAYWSTVEANYYAGINELPCSIQVTIREANGSISQYRFVGALLSLDDPGNWTGDTTVSQSLSFVCSRRLRVS